MDIAGSQEDGIYLPHYKGSHPRRRFVLFLSFHRAFCRLFNYTHQHMHTHIYTYIYIYYLRSLKFTLKHLKCSYMFRTHDHPQGAYIVPC